MIIRHSVTCRRDLTAVGRESEENLKEDAFQDYGLLPIAILGHEFYFSHTPRCEEIR